MIFGLFVVVVGMFMMVGVIGVFVMKVIVLCILKKWGFCVSFIILGLLGMVGYVVCVVLCLDWLEWMIFGVLMIIGFFMLF